MPDCSNCQTEITQNFCPNCGQKYEDRRIRFGHLLKDFISTFFSVDKSFFSNIRLMLVNPSRMVVNYWDGYRNFYFSPNKYLLISILFLGINFLITGNEFIGLKVSSTNEYFTLPMVLYLFLIPFITLSGYLVYMFRRRNFFEHLVLNVYNISFWTILFSVISVTFELLGWYDTGRTKFATQILYLLLILYWNSLAFKLRLHWRILLVLGNLVLFAVLLFLLLYFAGDFKPSGQ